MNAPENDLERRAAEYARTRGTVIEDRLGFGYDGIVFTTARQSAGEGAALTRRELLQWVRECLAMWEGPAALKMNSSASDMITRLRAVYRNGTFVPRWSCDLPEGTEVELTVEEPTLLPPTATDPEERERILERLLRRMDANPIPAGAPRFTREELHERR